MTDFVKLFREISKPEHPCGYMTWCYRMSEHADTLANNQELKEAILSKKHLLIDKEDPDYVIGLITDVRETENIPESHFWWYIDKL